MLLRLRVFIEGDMTGKPVKEYDEEKRGWFSSEVEASKQRCYFSFVFPVLLRYN